MLQVVGNRSAAFAIAKMPWQPTNISLAQSNQALSLALKSAGGFGVPCTDSIPFLALPGLVLSTVKGTIYPKDYALAIETTRSTGQATQSTGQALVSAVTRFATVQGTSAEQPVNIEISGFALAQQRRATACEPSGTEWRYQQLAMPEYACRCAANTECKDETVCVGAPSSGDRWAVAAVSSNLCKVTRGVESPSDNPLALGLGLGLGLGLPFTGASAYAAYKFYKVKGGKAYDSSTTDQPVTVEIVNVGQQSSSATPYQPSQTQSEVGVC
jgi:hypothetical protein